MQKCLYLWKRLAFIALASIRASGVDHCLCSNVELHRRVFVGRIVLRDLRRACEAMRLAAEFIFFSKPMSNRYVLEPTED